MNYCSCAFSRRTTFREALMRNLSTPHATPPTLSSLSRPGRRLGHKGPRDTVYISLRRVTAW